MKTKLAIATVLPLLFAAGVWACSSSSSTSGDDAGAGGDGSSQGDDGSVTGDDGATGDDGSAGGDSGGQDAAKDSGKKDAGKSDGGTTDAAKECGAPPTFTATPSAGVVCPFQADGSTPTCPTTPGEHCCIYPAKTNKDSTCNNVATACDTVAADAGLIADFECDEPGDCNGVATCCLVGNVMADSCGHFGQAIQGTRCRVGGCQAGETVVCSAQGDCGGDGGTCTGMATKGKNLGVCLP